MEKPTGRQVRTRPWASGSDPVPGLLIGEAPALEGSSIFSCPLAQKGRVLIKFPPGRRTLRWEAIG